MAVIYFISWVFFSFKCEIKWLIVIEWWQWRKKRHPLSSSCLLIILEFKLSFSNKLQNSNGYRPTNHSFFPWQRNINLTDFLQFQGIKISKKLLSNKMLEYIPITIQYFQLQNPYSKILSPQISRYSKLFHSIYISFTCYI